MFDVPNSSHYGALVTNGSMQVLVRKNATSSEGLFFRWENDSSSKADAFVRERLITEFGVHAEFIEGPKGLVFIKGGTLSSFLMCYSSGNICNAALEWVSLRQAWQMVFDLNDHEAIKSDSASLLVLDGWIRDKKRKLTLDSLDEEKKIWFQKFDLHCEHVRSFFEEYQAEFFPGTGMYSEYIQWTFSAAKRKIDGQENSSKYLRGLFERAAGKGKSLEHRQALLEAVHLNLALSLDNLSSGKYERLARRIALTLSFLEALNKDYGGDSFVLWQRGVKGAEGRWRDHVAVGRGKSEKIKELELLILDALRVRSLYRKYDQVEVVAFKVEKHIAPKMSELGLGDLFVGEDLHEFIWNFLIVNREAKKLLK